MYGKKKADKIFYTPPVQEMHTFGPQRKTKTKPTIRLLTSEIFPTRNRRNLPRAVTNPPLTVTPKQRSGPAHKAVKPAGAEGLTQEPLPPTARNRVTTAPPGAQTLNTRRRACPAYPCCCSKDEKHLATSGARHKTTRICPALCPLTTHKHLFQISYLNAAITGE